MGKTAIASTLLSIPEILSCVVSQVFLKQDDKNLNDPSVIWCTIAFNLTKSNLDIRKTIAKKLDNTTLDSLCVDIECQFKCLIEEPLKDVAEKLPAQPLVVVIDALDECAKNTQWRIFWRASNAVRVSTRVSSSSSQAEIFHPSRRR